MAAVRRQAGVVQFDDDHSILLPRSWDTTFYDCVAGRPIIIGGDCWRFAKFGRNLVETATVRDEYDPLKLFGEDLFGKRGEAIESGVKSEFFVADCVGQKLTLLVTRRVDLEQSGGVRGLGNGDS